MEIALVSSGSPSFDRFPPGGGIQYQIYHTALELSHQGHDPTIITREDDTAGGHSICIKEIDVSLNDEVASRIQFSIKAKNVIEQIEPDILFTYERFSAIFPSLLEIPNLFFTSNPDAMQFYRSFAINRNKANYIFFPIKNSIEEFVMRNSSKIIALNTDIEEYLHTRDIKHTEVIPNGINISKYQNKCEENYILFAGRLNEVKGCRVIFDAYKRIASKFPDIDLIMAGKGEMRGELQRRADSSGLSNRVHFPGWLANTQLHNYYSRCTIFVLPSLFEMAGISLLEAMASSKAVVASDVMGPRNIISHREDGLLFESGSVSGLANYLQLGLCDPQLRRKIGESARRTVENEYTFDHICEKIISVSSDEL